MESAAPTTASGHAVRFYDDEADLAEAVGEFLADGLTRGEWVLMIAVPAHRAALLRALRGRGIDTDRAIASRELTVLDAEELLARFMRGALPDRGLFRANLRSVLERFPPGRVRAYGEMVDVLWRRSQVGAALRLEELWNELQRSHDFSLLCAYVTGGFHKEPAGLREVCARHTQVTGWSEQESEDPRGGANPVLAQHARALAAEVGRRMEVEAALRQRSKRERDAAGQRAERLMKITAAIADAVTPEQVYDAVVDQVAAAIEASSAALWRLAEAGGSATLLRSVGYSPAAQQQLQVLLLDAVQRAPEQDAVVTGQPVWVDPRAALLQRYPHFQASVTSGRDARIACLPLRVCDRTLGVLGFTFEGGARIDGDERTFMMLVARYSAQALERLRLLENHS